MADARHDAIIPRIAENMIPGLRGLDTERQVSHSFLVQAGVNIEVPLTVLATPMRVEMRVASFAYIPHAFSEPHTNL